MKEILGGLALVAGTVVLLHVNLGQRDRRFKTGYKNNDVPTQMPLVRRLKWTGALWAIGALCLLDRSTLAGVAGVALFAVGAVGTWILYPQFWSRFQRNSTSNAAFVAARLSMSVALGGMVAFAASRALSDHPEKDGLSPTETARVVSPPAQVHSPRANARNEEVIDSGVRRAAAPAVIPVVVESQTPSQGAAELQRSSAAMPPNEAPANLGALRGARADVETDDQEDDNDRAPRDLRVRGALRDRAQGLPTSSSFNRQFPYTPPSEQDAADAGQRREPYPRPYNSANARNMYPSPERAVVVPSQVYPQDSEAHIWRSSPSSPTTSSVGPQGNGP